MVLVLYALYHTDFTKFCRYKYLKQNCFTDLKIYIQLINVINYLDDINKMYIFINWLICVILKKSQMTTKWTRTRSELEFTKFS